MYHTMYIGIETRKHTIPDSSDRSNESCSNENLNNKIAVVVLPYLKPNQLISDESLPDTIVDNPTSSALEGIRLNITRIEENGAFRFHSTHQHQQNEPKAINVKENYHQSFHKATATFSETKTDFSFPNFDHWNFVTTNRWKLLCIVWNGNIFVSQKI